jgi:glycosyltransferase involved in cell wall biosynthesis
MNTLQDRVVIIETISHEVLVALYNGCEALCFLLFSEGFGWSLIEAQAAELSDCLCIKSYDWYVAVQHCMQTLDLMNL